MINLRSLMDLLPYYFREQDTYKVNGKGILERYLEIFKDYFDNQIINNIKTLDDIIDFDKTPEIYLGYLWEFLGSMPYANPKAIDPKKWKQYFNGFDNDSTIQALSKLWVYRKDSDSDHYNLDLDQVRALVKYSVALFSIRGTKKFFEVLLRMYGFDVTISNGSTYPITTSEDDDDHDYWGSDTDYWGTNDDYAGSIDSLFNIKTENTKLDSEWLNLDEGTIDNHVNCNKLVNVNFRLRSDYVYNVSSNEFKRLHDRMFNLINMFLPIGTRPHLIWDNVNVGNNYEVKISRSIEVYVDRTPIDWDSSDDVFVVSSEYPGWYRVYDRSSHYIVPARDFSWAPLRFMVKINDTGGTPAFISDQPKKFIVAFGNNFSDSEYDDGHIFTINPGNNNRYYPKFKVSVPCEEDFDLTNGTIDTFIIANWKKEFNYTLFKHYNHSVDTTLSNSNKYVPILIQSAFVRTYTNNANPEDDTFIPQQVINSTTGELLTLCEDGTTLPDRDGNYIDYSQYKDKYMYVQHIYKPGVYEFAVLDKLEYKFTLEVKVVEEVLSISLESGSSDIVIDNDNTETVVGLEVSSNLSFLKTIFTLPFYINDNGGQIWSSIVSGADTGNKPSEYVGNIFNKPYYRFSSIDIYHLNQGQLRSNPINFNLAYLTNPVNRDSQYIKFIVKKYSDLYEQMDNFSIKYFTFYPVTGNIYVEEEVHEFNEDVESIYFKYGDQVCIPDTQTPFRNLFVIQDPVLNTGISDDGSIFYTNMSVSTRNIYLPDGLSRIAPTPTQNKNGFIIEYNGLYDDETIIKEFTNPVNRYWNNGELITLSDPGHYRFYGASLINQFSGSYIDINVLSNKYNVNYFLELEDGDKSDDEVYMLRTLIPNRPTSGNTVPWSFDFIISVDKSVVEAQDILVIDPDAFDLEVLVYRGGTPNRGTLLGSWTASTEVISDDLGNVLPYYKVKGTISVTWDGTYTIGSGPSYNFPPGLYCVELHDKNHLWPGTSSYKVVDAYVVPQKFDGNLYFDVDVISKAWTSPAGQVYDIDPVTGKYTWGWFKTNGDYLHSVRLVRYDPAVDTPHFRLKLTNNTIGYTRVYMYKLVENGDEWDINATYPSVLAPVIKSNTPHTGVANPHWIEEAIPKDWGFPGEYDDESDSWDYSKGSTGVVGYTGRWLFTGSVYQLGEIIIGPQEPGKYLFLVNQLGIDTKVINYAYLEVKEIIQYSLIVDPLLAILQGTAVGTTVNAISSAKFTNEVLKVRVINPDGTALEGYYDIPYAFYAYQAGVYTFELFKFEGGQHISLGLVATFKVLTDNGISDEYLSWEWSDTSDREVQVVTTSNDVDWTVKVQNE